jgi:catechol 2,3-dioxygenase-like lactoylglutathione lyase family enzyme
MAQDAAPQPGDLGICWVCLKTRDPEAAFECLSRGDVRPLDTIVRDPCGNSSFFVRDPGGNHLRIVPGSGWFARSAAPTGGVSGCAIGVSDIDRARAFYDHAFGYDRVIYDERGTFADLACLPGGHERLRRLMLSRSQAPRGAFADWLGPSQVELVQSLWRTPRGSYAGRHWGDHGFMHLCFEVCGMDGWKERLAHLGFHFTVDSADSFDMGGDLGRFAYVEDPDGTLVELEETHRIGIVKRWGWSLDLRRRPPRKPLPRWMLGMMRFNRVRWT